jgi:hypothetical protein
MAFAFQALSAGSGLPARNYGVLKQEHPGVARMLFYSAGTRAT